MPRLAQDNNGNYRARKRLPGDVREDYGRLFDAHYEAKFSAPKSLMKQEAMRRYGDWLAEAEGRIDAIRKQRRGEGAFLTHRQARPLAGEWYDWFIARHSLRDAEWWEQFREQINENIKLAVGVVAADVGCQAATEREDSADADYSRPFCGVGTLGQQRLISVANAGFGGRVPLATLRRV
jgi:hypothetical protein